MKRPLSTAAFLLSATLLFVQCKKEPSDAVFDVQFYTPQSATQMYLYLEGDSIGALPYLAAEPTCGSTATDGVAPLHKQLRAGSYRIVGKDSQGAVRSSGTFRIDTGAMGASGNIGGLMISGKETCVSVGLFF